MRPTITLTSTVLDSPTPATLAAFYSRLLGWPLGPLDDPTWITVRPPGGGPGLSFQLEPHYVRPVWPSTPDAPQQMSHLDFEVDDLATAQRHAQDAGATLTEWQPQPHVRVLTDPDGHPFCLWTRS